MKHSHIFLSNYDLRFIEELKFAQIDDTSNHSPTLLRSRPLIGILLIIVSVESILNKSNAPISDRV
jgi:hypothetical protein